MAFDPGGATASRVAIPHMLPSTAMQPLYDPVRSLVYAAGGRAIRHVLLGGQQVVRDGKALAFGYGNASTRLEMAQRRALAKVPGFGPGAVPRKSCRRPSYRSEPSPDRDGPATPKPSFEGVVGDEPHSSPETRSMDG